MLSTRDIAWIAGLLEGDGTFNRTSPSTQGTHPSIRIALCMTDCDVVLRVANLLGFGSFHAFLNRKNKLSTKIFYRWECSGVNAAALMMTIYPLMGIRRQEKIEELVGFYKSTRVCRRKPRLARKIFTQPVLKVVS